MEQIEIDAANNAAAALAAVWPNDPDYARASLGRIAYGLGWREGAESGGSDGEAWTRQYVTREGERITCWLSGHVSDSEIMEGGLGFELD